MIKLKSYERHIQKFSLPNEMPHSYCGFPLKMVWAFENIDHAYETIKAGSIQLPCPNCLKEIIETLTS